MNLIMIIYVNTTVRFLTYEFVDKHRVIACALRKDHDTDTESNK